MAEKNPMIRVIETRDGMRMPALGVGTWRMGERAGRKKDEIAAIRLAMDLGVTLIDTAEMYGDAETVVGEAIKGRRDGLFIVSKVLPSNASRKGTIQAADRSLKKLGIDCMDLYLLHWEGAYPLEETLEAFESLRAQGKIKHHGVSNFDTRAMADSAHLPDGKRITTNQVMYNLGRRGIERNLLPWCRQHKVAVMAYSPLDQGSLQATGALSAVARRHNVSPETIAIAWTMRDPWVASIPKTSNPAHVRANVAAAGIELTPDDLAELDRAYPAPKRDVPLDIV
jgi:diketogulonate reductase-like aldo/keto reductase